MILSQAEVALHGTAVACVGLCAFNVDYYAAEMIVMRT